MQVKEEMPAGSFAPLSKRGLHMLGEARWLLGYALVVLATFQFLLKTWSLAFETFLFVIVTGGFLLTTYLLKGFRGLVGMVTDTWTQRLATLFLAVLALSFLWGDKTIYFVLAFFRLPTYLIIIAIMVEAMRGGGERIYSLAWTVLGSICFIYALALTEFYFGSNVLGLDCSYVEKCWVNKGNDWNWKGLLAEGNYIDDFKRHGGILNATVIGDAYGLSRMGLFAVLAYTLGMGVIMNSDRARPGLIAAGLITFVLIGAMLTGSRSAALVLLFLWVVFAALLAFDRRTFHLVKVCIVTNLVIFAVVFVVWKTMPAGITAFDRLLDTMRSSDSLASEDLITESDLIYEARVNLDPGRIKKWKFALDLIPDNLVGGLGFRMYHMEYSRSFPKDHPIGIHNGYLKVLVETGLLGAAPFLALLAFALMMMLRPKLELSPMEAVWRITFLSAFIAILTLNFVDTHSEDRYFWIVLAFAAVLETWKRRKYGLRDIATETNRV